MQPRLVFEPFRKRIRMQMDYILPFSVVRKRCGERQLAFNIRSQELTKY